MEVKEKQTDDSEKINGISKLETPPRPKGLGVRHFQIALMFFGLLVAYSLRVNLSVGIVPMLDNSTNPNFQSYDWNSNVKGMVLSSFFWGYIVSQIPAGLLAQRFGARIVYLLAATVCSVLTLLSPLLADVSWEIFVVSRVLQGLAQGCIYPCTHTLLSKWVHPTEIGFLTTFTYSGTQAGTVITLAISGLLANSAAGWPSIFYVTGGIAALWTITYFLLGCNSPADSKRISAEERAFIESAEGATISRKKTMPWKSVFTSTPFIALFIVHCCQNWGFWTLLTEIPSYMNSALGFDIKDNALLSALPYFVMYILSLVMSPISDYLINNGYITKTNGRKIFNSIAHYSPMLALIGLAFVTADTPVLAVALLTIAVGLNAGTYVGYVVNHLDLAPNFAGTLMGITNGCSNVLSILGPLFVGYIVTDETNSMQWRIIFFISSGFYLVGNTFFVIFGQATIQPWNTLQSKDTEGDDRIDASMDTIATLDVNDMYKKNDTPKS